MIVVGGISGKNEHLPLGLRCGAVSAVSEHYPIWLSNLAHSLLLYTPMAKKRKSTKDPGSAPQATKTKKTTKLREAPRKHTIDLAFRSGPLRGKAARVCFLCDVAAAGNISVCSVRKILDGRAPS